MVATAYTFLKSKSFQQPTQVFEGNIRVSLTAHYASKNFLKLTHSVYRLMR